MVHVPTHIFNAVMGTDYLACTIWLHADAHVTIKLLERRTPHATAGNDLRPTSKQVYDMARMMEKELAALNTLVYTHPDTIGGLKAEDLCPE